MIARPYAPKKLYGNRDFWPQAMSYGSSQNMFGIGVIGGKLYCPAGQVAGAYTNITRVYDPKANTWSTVANIPTARHGASTAVVNGLMYVIGGLYSGPTYTTTNECYNPVTNSWSSKTAMTTAKYMCMDAVVGTKIYIIGGWNGSAVATNYCYDTVADSWSTKTAIPAATSEGACIAYGTKIYCIGGYTVSAVATNYCYDTVADSWSTKAPMPTATYATGYQTCLIGKYVYIFGGYTTGGVTTIWRYDIEANTWLSVGNLPVATYYAPSAYVDGAVYLISGAATYKNTFSKKADWLYSPSIAASHTDNRAFKGVG